MDLGSKLGIDPMDTLLPGVIAGVIACVIYFVPAIVASRRQHHNAGAIAMLNLLLGWTVLGWIIALVWACTDPSPNAAQFSMRGAGHRIRYVALRCNADDLQPDQAQAKDTPGLAILAIALILVVIVIILWIGARTLGWFADSPYGFHWQ